MGDAGANCVEQQALEPMVVQCAECIGHVETMMNGVKMTI